MEREVTAWATARNEVGSTIDWRFTTAAKLKQRSGY